MFELQAKEQNLFEDSETLADELIAGLTQTNKYINPKFFYDEYGSTLFEKIMSLPEYYPTRTELQLLQQHREEIAHYLGPQQILIEPGAGNCEKVRHLLPALEPRCYVPIDISAEFLFSSADQLQQEFQHIDIHPIAADMRAEIQLPNNHAGLKRTIFYPGSTIGNYSPKEALDFLQHSYQMMESDGGLLIGVDLEKESHLLHRAYNDAAGVTAAFNLNILDHANRLLGANFDTGLFDHVAFYNDKKRRIEMHLQSSVAHEVKLLDRRIHFQAGERIHTEYSYKYTLDSFAELASRAGLHAVKHWVDDQQLFSLQYFTRR